MAVADWDETGGRGFDQVFTADPADVLIDCEMAPSDFTAIPLPPSY